MIRSWMLALVTALVAMRRRAVTRFRRRRVPVILQLQATECGAACLAMVLGAWGRTIRIADLREIMGSGRDGVTATRIIAAATAHGLRMQAFALDLDQFDKVPLPAIVHWDFDHFVVVERWSSRQVTIVDPGRGRCRLPVAEFSNHFTGVVLACEPADGFSRTRGTPPAWHRYLISMLPRHPACSSR